jgi:hypothetical protein
MKNLKSLTQAATLTGLGMLVLYALLPLVGEETKLRRLLVLLGADIGGGGYIQAMTYLAFFWAMSEVKTRIGKARRERKAFQLSLLPLSEKHVFLPEDIHNLKFRLVELARKEPYLLVDLLKKVCMKFRSSENLGELMNIITIQTEIYQEKAESDQSIIRYLAWVIPSLGFIGTVIGISLSLQIANSGDMKAITDALAVAFDTTLIALVLSIVIMWYLHQLQEMTDHLHSDIKEYVIEHFLNKIELSKT